MTAAEGAICKACGQPRPWDELLKVTWTSGKGVPFFICRPGLNGACMHVIGSRLVHTIALAVPEPGR